VPEREGSRRGRGKGSKGGGVRRRETVEEVIPVVTAWQLNEHI